MNYRLSDDTGRLLIALCDIDEEIDRLKDDQYQQSLVDNLRGQRTRLHTRLGAAMHEQHKQESARDD